MRIATLVAFASLLGCATTTPEHHDHPAHHDEGEHHGHDWDAVYAKGTGFTKAPNALLMSSVAGVKPGLALDVGMGQGRNALGLARAGWKVTGFDPSTEGVRQAKEQADTEHLSLEAVVAGDETFDFGTAKYDLVALIYVGGADIAPKVAASLKPGGLVVVEFFEYDPAAKFNVPGSFKPGELETLFPGFDVLRSEAVEDKADWSLRQNKLIRFVAKKR